MMAEDALKRTRLLVNNPRPMTLADARGDLRGGLVKCSPKKRDDHNKEVIVSGVLKRGSRLEGLGNGSQALGKWHGTTGQPVHVDMDEVP